MAALYTGRVEIESGALNVRSAPEGSVIGKLKNGDEVQVLCDLGEWAQIEHAGTTGFAAKRYICFVRAEQHVQLVVEDGAGKTFLPSGDITARIVTGEID